MTADAERMAETGQRLGVSAADALANLEANAAVLKDAGTSTLFGQPVGDGLDEERADARIALEIVRALLAHGARVAVFEGGIMLRPADTMQVTPEQAGLLQRLDRS